MICLPSLNIFNKALIHWNPESSSQSKYLCDYAITKHCIDEKNGSVGMVSLKFPLKSIETWQKHQLNPLTPLSSSLYFSFPLTNCRNVLPKMHSPLIFRGFSHAFPMVFPVSCEVTACRCLRPCRFSPQIPPRGPMQRPWRPVCWPKSCSALEATVTPWRLSLVISWECHGIWWLIIWHLKQFLGQSAGWSMDD